MIHREQESPELVITTAVRESPSAIAGAICVVWESDLDTPAGYGEHCRIHNADFTHSVMAYLPDGRFVGIGMLCRRGDRGFVLDFGVAPAFRGRGWGHMLFAALVDQMRRAGLRGATLLVNAENEAALRIYQRAGFKIVREMLTLQGNVPAYAPASAQELYTDVPSTIMAWFSPARAARPCWERDLPSLLAMAEARAFENNYGFLLARRSPYQPCTEIAHMGLDSDVQAEHVNALLYAASVAFGPSLPLAIPQEPINSRVHRQLAGLGFEVVDREYEMRLDLDAGTGRR